MSNFASIFTKILEYTELAASIGEVIPESHVALISAAVDQAVKELLAISAAKNAAPSVPVVDIETGAPLAGQKETAPVATESLPTSAAVPTTGFNQPWTNPKPA